MNYEKDIYIDNSALDVEWLNQASLFMKYAKNAADCRRTLDLKKEALDLTKADLDKAIRERPAKFKIREDVKITEAVVSSTILNQPKFKEANQAYIEAKYKLDIAQAAVSAMNQRKDALENMVRLHGQKYFAGPQMPRDLHEERIQFEKDQKQVDSGISKKLNKSTRTK